ncbi:MAG: polyribonucleotide nucleotidyltransferase [Aquificaceae bacterium]
MKRSFRIANSTIEVEVGQLAKLADGSVVVKQGDTAVLVTAVVSQEPSSGVDFVPLTVDYREQSSSWGKIPGGFVKREGKPTDREVLVSRLIDRPIRPLFPEGFFNEVVITALLLSADDKFDPDVLCITGASLALEISKIPFEGPVAGVRVCQVDGQFVANPTYQERQRATLDMVIAASFDSIIMVEGGSKEVSEETLLSALSFGHEAVRECLEVQKEISREIGAQKMTFESIELDREIQERLINSCESAILESMQISDKKERKAVAANALKAFLDSIDQSLHFKATYQFKKLSSQLMRQQILKTRKRIDGRSPEEIRPIEIKIHPFERPHGSAIFTRGQTQAFATATLGSPEEAQMVESIHEGETAKRFMLHYNFPPFSSGEAKPWGPPRRREIGHGALAERALEPLIPPESEFPYIIRVVSNILESNGSTSMATVCAGSLALFDAGVPLKRHVAGIAMGLIIQGDDFVVLSDILGDEDQLGDMDFKVAGTEVGITSFQMDIKVKGVTKEILKRALMQARDGRLHIIELMKAAISKPREQVSQYAPIIEQMIIPEDKATVVIGPGGKNVKDFRDRLGVSVWIHEGGRVTLTSTNREAISKVRSIIESLTLDLEIGKIYVGKVTRVEPYGVFVEVLPGKVGLLHISKIDGGIKDARGRFNVGDELPVRVIEVDDQGRAKLAGVAQR